MTEGCLTHQMRRFVLVCLSVSVLVCVAVFAPVCGGGRGGCVWVLLIGVLFRLPTLPHACMGGGCQERHGLYSMCSQMLISSIM